MPVIGCAACLTPDDEPNFFFAGVCALLPLFHRQRCRLPLHAPVFTARLSRNRPLEDGPGTRRWHRPVGRRVYAAQIATSERFSHAVSPRDFACAVFTLSLGGMVTLLNTSSASIFAGDLVEWTLSYSDAMKSHAKRARHGPRRIVRIASRFAPRASSSHLAAHPLPLSPSQGIQTATVSSPKVIGRALSFAKPYAAACKLPMCPSPPVHPQLTTPSLVFAGASRSISCSSSDTVLKKVAKNTTHTHHTLARRAPAARPVARGPPSSAGACRTFCGSSRNTCSTLPFLCSAWE